MNTDQMYDKLVNLVKKDDRVLGMILGGSRGKGLINQFSDYDIKIIVTDESEVHEQIFKDFSVLGDLGFSSIEKFRDHALWDSREAWDRYNYSFLKATVDKTGEIQRLIDSKGKIPEEHYESHIKHNFHFYVNSIYRSMKCHRAGDILACKLEASRGISGMLSVIFAVHDHRLLPYYKYLHWEIKHYPLYKMEELGMSGENLLEILDGMLVDGNISGQQRIFEIVQKLMLGEGLGDEILGWDQENIDIIRTHRHS